MGWDIFLILLTDGIANGAVYLLAGLGLVLIFSVTRVAFVPFGDIAVFAALSLASFERGQLPGTVWLVATLVGITLVKETFANLREGEAAKIPQTIIMYGLVPAVPCALAWTVAFSGASELIQILAAILLVVPIAPMLNQLLLRPIANASSLVLFMAALVLHFLLTGLGLMFMGPEGFRTKMLLDGQVNLLPDYSISFQSLLMIVAALVLTAMFFLLFQHTTSGKALRATSVNRIGARLVGIRPARTATLAYVFSSLLAGLIGILIAPVTTLYYDSGFTLGLKAFVAGIIGGLVSYPLTALGGLAVGIVESFGSFWSGAMKDVIVFSLLIPTLLVRSYYSASSEENEEEID